MINMIDRYKDTIDFLVKNSPFQPEVSLILGSGLGDFATSLKVHKSFLTSKLPNYPPSTVEGHEGKILFAKYAGKKLLVFQGRIHFYEGYKIYECVLPVFISHRLKSRKILITNAAGGINPNFSPGDLMLAQSFNSIAIKKELTQLIGVTSVEGNNRFLDFPSGEFNETIKRAALEEKIKLQEGSYWFNKGPSYETPAEIRMMARAGFDAVGMSTAHEAIYASHLGMQVASISCITNLAAGISQNKLSHAEVTETADKVKEIFERLVKRTITFLN